VPIGVSDEELLPLLSLNVLVLDLASVSGLVGLLPLLGGVLVFPNPALKMPIPYLFNLFSRESLMMLLTLFLLVTRALLVRFYSFRNRF
jgi:hypothetical protein